jgi:acetylornithine deacetylase/succinyl-diaminopimelate desuccinylase-like protein
MFPHLPIGPRTLRALAAIPPLLCAIPALVAAQPDNPQQLRRDILRELIEINTSDSAARTGDAARAMQRRLVGAGIPASDVRVLGETPRYQALVARLRGRNSALRPMLLMAHLDVVPARKEDWSTDPFRLVEKDGWLYGRGTTDNKAGAAILVATLIRLKQDSVVPDRDIIIMLSADEETTGSSTKWLVEKNRPLIDAEFALNTDAGGAELRDGKHVNLTVQTAEKVYITYELEVRNRGGHSSLPEPDNAIYRLSAGLGRLAAYTFPVRLNETTRAFFERSAATQPANIASDMRALAMSNDAGAARRLSAVPLYNSTMRTTCVATRLFAGHADNALPQVARATVNCRLLPDHAPDSATAQLRRILADTAIHVSVSDPPTLSPASPLRPDVMGAVERLATARWPGIAIAPEMSTGATDGLYLRNAGIPVYGIGALFDRVDDVRAHGRDERVNITAFNDAGEFWYELVKALATK